MNRKQAQVKWATILLILVIATGLLSSQVFAVGCNDVKDHWAEDVINKWLELGLATGFSDHTFRPNGIVSRAEFFTFVSRAYSLSDPNEVSQFTDLPKTAWFYETVSAVVTAGIAMGCEDNLFKPNEPITRQETAVVLNRLLEHVEGKYVPFKDDHLISSWARDSVENIAATGIMEGYPDGTFGPQNHLTRAESVVVLDRCLEISEKLIEKPVEKVLDDSLPEGEPSTISDENKSSGGSGGGSSGGGSSGGGIIVKTKYKITYGVIGKNGTLTAKVEMNHINSGTQIEKGKKVEFTATPDQGYKVSAWKRNGSDVIGITDNNYIVTNLQNDTDVYVEFEKIPIQTSASLIELYREGVLTEYNGIQYHGVRLLEPEGVYNVELDMNKVNDKFIISGYNLQLKIDGIPVVGEVINNTFVIKAEYAVLPSIQGGNYNAEITINPETLANAVVFLVPN